VYNSQEKISERQKWGASHLILYYSTTQHRCVNQIPAAIFVRVMPQGKEKAETWAWNGNILEILLPESQYGQPHTGTRKKARQKPRQALTSSFRLFGLLWVQPATNPPTGSTKQGLLEDHSDLPHSHQSGNGNICWGVTQHQLNPPPTEKIWTPFQDKKTWI